MIKKNASKQNETRTVIILKTHICDMLFIDVWFICVSSLKSMHCTLLDVAHFRFESGIRWELKIKAWSVCISGCSSVERKIRQNKTYFAEFDIAWPT